MTKSPLVAAEPSQLGGEPAIAPPLRVLASPASMPPESNPYIDGLYGAIRAEGVIVDDFTRARLLGRYDVIHVHWPEFLVRWNGGIIRGITDALKVICLISVARWRGARLVWTGHDLAPHESRYPRLESAYLRAFFRRTDHLISLSKAGIEALRAGQPEVRGAPASVVPHGHYRDHYPPAGDRAAARSALRISGSGPLLLALGMIRSYKNFPALVTAVRQVGGPDVQLAVAGAVFEPRLADELAAAKGDDPRIYLRLSRASVAEVALWHAASDVVTLPYTEGTTLNSGAAHLALSYDRPIVVRDTPTMRELRDLVGASWVYLYEGGPAEAVALAIVAVSQERPASCNLDALNWAPLGRATVAVYHSATRRPRRTRRSAH